VAQHKIYVANLILYQGALALLRINHLFIIGFVKPVKQRLANVKKY